jgi:WXXGXW repeat (2 copies)
MNKPRLIKLTAVLLIAASLGACVVVPAQRPYYATDTVVPVAPPPPQVEYVGVPPVYGQIWIGGFWGWQGGRHVWNGGHWDAPRQGYRWAPHAWVREGNAYRLHQGHWERH